MNQTNSSKKTQSSKSKRTETKAVGYIFKIYPPKRQQYLLHLWKESDGKWYSCRTFYTKISGGAKSLFPRRQRPRPVLQLQYKSRRQSIPVWLKTWRPDGKRTIRLKAKKR